MKRSRIITCKINGQDIAAREDETILELSRQNGIPIPTLCYLEGVTPWGGCRLCMVEIKGSNKLFPAYMTHPAEGMEVTTQSERLLTYRKQVLDLYSSERNHVCAVCVSNGNCELQNLPFQTGMTHLGIPYLNPSSPLDFSHPRFGLDHNRCILCTRCVRVCDEVEGAHTWDVMGRGRWLKNAIVQPGYTRAGEPILFIAQRRSPLVSNDLFFSDKGVKVELAELEKMSESLTWYQEPDKKVN